MYEGPEDGVCFQVTAGWLEYSDLGERRISRKVFIRVDKSERALLAIVKALTSPL